MRFTDLGREIREQSCPTSPRSPGAAGDSGSPSLVRREAGSQVRGGGHTAQLGHQAEGDRGLLRASSRGGFGAAEGGGGLGAAVGGDPGSSGGGVGAGVVRGVGATVGPDGDGTEDGEGQEFATVPPVSPEAVAEPDQQVGDVEGAGGEEDMVLALSQSQEDHTGLRRIWKGRRTQLERMMLVMKWVGDPVYGERENSSFFM